MTLYDFKYRANRTIRTIRQGGLFMNAKQKLHQAHLNEWAARISDQKASGLTIRQWCDQNNVSFHKYNYWKHLLKEEVVDQMLPDIVPLEIPSSLQSTEAPVVHDLSHASVPAAEASLHANFTNRANRANFENANIRLCIDGVCLELQPSVSEDFLRTLVRAVHYA